MKNLAITTKEAYFTLLELGTSVFFLDIFKTKTAKQNYRGFIMSESNNNISAIIFVGDEITRLYFNRASKITHVFIKYTESGSKQEFYG